MSTNPMNNENQHECFYSAAVVTIFVWDVSNVMPATTSLFNSVK